MFKNWISKLIYNCTTYIGINFVVFLVYMEDKKEILFKKYPKRIYNIGILEQSMISLAAGLSNEGLRPIVHTIAPFIVSRALEQLKIDFGYKSLSILIIEIF